MIRNLASLVLIILLGIFSNCSNHSMAEKDFIPLFNGETLDGWVNVNCAPETWTVQDGLIICTGIPTGILRTDKQYENFILELEWMHLHEGGNAGLFIHSDDITALGKPFSRSIECQIMDGNHGDVFAIHGARMTRDNEDPFDKIGWMRSFPTQERAKPAGNWNHYKVESNDGILTLAVNGEIVSRAYHINPRKGYICLESEGSEVHFKNIRIKELPGSSPLPEQTAFEDRGYTSLYNGLDLRGWRISDGGGSSWESDNWRLLNAGSGQEMPKAILWSEKVFKNFTLIVDWMFTGEPVASSVPVIMPDGKQAAESNGNKITVPIRYTGEGGIFLHGSDQVGVTITSWPEGSGGITGYKEDGFYDSDTRKLATPILNANNNAGKWNRLEMTVKDRQISVVLNGKQVIKNALIENLPESGPIGIQVPDFPMEFANVYIKEL